jgi:hypothetical protein
MSSVGLVRPDLDVLNVKAGQTQQKEVVQRDELTPEERLLEHKLRLRIDFLIMPSVILVYMMNFIDR